MHAHASMCMCSCICVRVCVYVCGEHSCVCYVHMCACSMVSDLVVKGEVVHAHTCLSCEVVCAVVTVQ